MESSAVVRGVAGAAAAPSPFLFLLLAARLLVVARVFAPFPVTLLALAAVVTTLATSTVILVTATAALLGRPRPVLLLFLLLRLVGRRGAAAGPSSSVGALRRSGGRPRQVELRERRDELLVVAVLFGARAAHVQDNVLVRVHLEKVAALVREVARVTALFAGGTHGV